MGKEEAEAVTEVAKTLREYRPEVRDAGAFFAKILGRPMEQASGLVSDAIGTLRLELALRYYDRLKRGFADRGLEGPTRAAAMSVALPLLEAASMEEDDSLQEMFAQLLINATDASAGVLVNKSFVETVRVMSPLEAQILNAIYDAPEDAKREGGMLYTHLLPGKYLNAPSQEMDKILDVPMPEENEIALASLASAGCIQGAATWGGFSILSQAIITPYGRALVKATRAPKQE